MTPQTQALAASGTERVSSAMIRLRAARDRGVSWLLNHVSSNGEPVGSRKRNGWARVPWALAVSGEVSAGAGVVAWAERTQMDADGGFAPGPALGSGQYPAYPLAQFAIGCWLLERFSTSLAAMGALRRMQDPHCGGLPIKLPINDSPDIYDLLSTAQTGLAAVVSGQDDIADLVYRWVAELYKMQTKLDQLMFFTYRRKIGLLEEPPEGLAWAAITQFDKPRQTYYTPGMAAVFLASYAQRRGLGEPLKMASHLLLLNIHGIEDQFTDLGSVQACKFGWGAAAMLVAAPKEAWLDHVVRMVDWFIERQAEDGSWAPSIFLVPEPEEVDKLVKTSEHVMEVNAMLAALGTAQARST